MRSRDLTAAQEDTQDVADEVNDHYMAAKEQGREMRQGPGDCGSTADCRQGQVRSGAITPTP